LHTHFRGMLSIEILKASYILILKNHFVSFIYHYLKFNFQSLVVFASQLLLTHDSYTSVWFFQMEFPNTRKLIRNWKLFIISKNVAALHASEVLFSLLCLNFRKKCWSMLVARVQSAEIFWIFFKFNTTLCVIIEI
jgi:hypothetical protein